MKFILIFWYKETWPVKKRKESLFPFSVFQEKSHSWSILKYQDIRVKKQNIIKNSTHTHTHTQSRIGKQNESPVPAVASHAGSSWTKAPHGSHIWSVWGDLPGAVVLKWRERMALSVYFRWILSTAKLGKWMYLWLRAAEPQWVRSWNLSHVWPDPLNEQSVFRRSVSDVPVTL